ncbi:hypothetical protein IscW_ISCW022290, partial [Ixodes scapularis]
ESLGLCRDQRKRSPRHRDICCSRVSHANRPKGIPKAYWNLRILEKLCQGLRTVRRAADVSHQGRYRPRL